MKFLRFLPFIVAVLTCANAFSEIKKCQELKEEIEAKLNDKGVTGHYLTIVPTSQIKDQKIVGSCDGGKNKITYTKTSATPIAILSKPTTDKETPLFSNFEPDTSPSMPKGGWILGTDAQYRVPITMVGLLVTPQITESLARVEIVVSRISGGDKIDGYLMNDNDGPGDLIEKLSFTIPPKASPEPTIATARSSKHPELLAGKRYWLVLAAPDLAKDKFFWHRHADQPWTTVALRLETTDRFQVQNGTLGAMLRVYGTSY